MICVLSSSIGGLLDRNFKTIACFMSSIAFSISLSENIMPNPPLMFFGLLGGMRNFCVCNDCISACTKVLRSLIADPALPFHHTSQSAPKFPYCILDSIPWVAPATGGAPIQAYVDRRFNHPYPLVWLSLLCGISLTEKGKSTRRELSQTAVHRYHRVSWATTLCNFTYVVLVFHLIDALAEPQRCSLNISPSWNPSWLEYS